MNLTDQEILELTALCDAVVDGTLTDGQQARLTEWLGRSDAARRFYVQFLGLSASLHQYASEMQTQQTLIHALLTWQQGRAAVPAPVVLAPMDSQTVRSIILSPLGRVLPVWGRVLAATAAVLIIGFAFWFGLNRVHTGVSVVIPKGVSVEILAAVESPYQVGQRVVWERLEMKTGTLRFRISSGAVVDVEGPVALEIVDAMRLRLLRGNITTDVGTEAKGFEVETANARVLDIGTRFGVSVGNEGNTDIVVFEGEVEVHRAGKPLTRESRLASLYEGEAARLTARDAKIQRLQSLALRGDRLAIRGLNAPASSVISNVTDNIKQANFYRCYTIVPGGMTEGAPASLVRRGHRKLTWQAQPGQPFPTELQGADVIGTFQAEGGRRALADIHLDLARPCAVYVLFDSRAAPPDWLRRDFQDTGLRLRSGPWWPHLVETKNLTPDANNEIYIFHSVWRKAVPGSGRVTLGAPATKGVEHPYAMYGLAVKSLQ